MIRKAYENEDSNGVPFVSTIVFTLCQIAGWQVGGKCVCVGRQLFCRVSARRFSRLVFSDELVSFRLIVAASSACIIIIDLRRKQAHHGCVQQLCPCVKPFAFSHYRCVHRRVVPRLPRHHRHYAFFASSLPPSSVCCVVFLLMRVRWIEKQRTKDTKRDKQSTVDVECSCVLPISCFSFVVFIFVMGAAVVCAVVGIWSFDVFVLICLFIVACVCDVVRIPAVRVPVVHCERYTKVRVIVGRCIVRDECLLRDCCWFSRCMDGCDGVGTSTLLC